SSRRPSRRSKPNPRAWKKPAASGTTIEPHSSAPKTRSPRRSLRSKKPRIARSTDSSAASLDHASKRVIAVDQAQCRVTEKSFWHTKSAAVFNCLERLPRGSAIDELGAVFFGARAAPGDHD